MALHYARCSEIGTLGRRFGFARKTPLAQEDVVPRGRSWVETDMHF